MKVIVKRWGNSAAVCLPADLMKAANLSINQTVEIEVRDGALTIRSLARNRPTLEAPLARTPNVEHLPGALDENARRQRNADDAFEQMVARMQTPESKAVAKSLMTISTKELRESLNKAPTPRSNG